MAKLKLPDGRTITFPDGLAPEQVKKIVDAAKAAPPQSDTMRTVDDRVRALARGVPIIGGAMDEISAGLNTGFGYLGDYDAALQQERARDRQFDAENPYESFGLQATGSVGGTAAAMRGIGSPPVPQTLPGKVGAGAGAGGLLGGLEAFTRAEGGFENRWDAAKKAAGPSAIIGGAFPLLGYGVGKVKDAFRKPAPSGLTPQTLMDEAAPMFERVRRSDIVVKPDAYDSMLDELYNVGNSGGMDDAPRFIPELMPELSTALNRLERWRGQPLPYEELMGIRKVLKAAHKLDNKEQGKLIGKMIDRWDEMLDTLTPNALASGADDPATVATIHSEARQMWTRARNAQLLENIVENAKNTVGANYSDAQLRTAVAQQLRAIAKDDFKRHKWLGPAERKAILSVIRTGDVEDFLRKTGKYSPLTFGGAARLGGLSYVANQFIPGSGAIVGPLLGAAGLASRPAAEKIGKRNTAVLMETLLQGKEVIPPAIADDLARLGVIYGAPVAGRAGAPVAGLLGGEGW